MNEHGLISIYVIRTTKHHVTIYWNRYRYIFVVVFILFTLRLSSSSARLSVFGDKYQKLATIRYILRAVQRFFYIEFIVNNIYSFVGNVLKIQLT